jgi:hypothetical protein
MKKSVTRILIGLALVGAGLLVGPITKSKPEVFAQSNGCQLKSLSGIYGFPFNGFFGDSSPYIPVAGAGTFTFRPDGTVARRANASFGGSLFSLNDGGTYVLNEDCSFTANVPGETWDLIPVAEGKQLEFFINTPLRTAAGTMTRQ